MAIFLKFESDWSFRILDFLSPLESLQFSTVLLLVSVRLKQVCSSTWVANFTRGWTRCALGHACTYTCAPNVPSADLFLASVFVQNNCLALRKQNGLRSRARTMCPPCLRRQFQTTPGRPLTHGSPCLRHSVANERWLSIWARAPPRKWIRFFASFTPVFEQRRARCTRSQATSLHVRLYIDEFRSLNDHSIYSRPPFLPNRIAFRRNPQDEGGRRFGASHRP